MKKMLIAGRSQFGYHSDTYYMCKYLRDDWDITYISWDYGQERIHMRGVKTQYVSRKGSFVRRKSRFIRKISKEIQNTQFDIQFIKEFKGCSVLKLLNPSKTFIFDIRSGAVDQNRFFRMCLDGILKLEGSVFDYKTIISKSLADKLKISAHLLPLGADIISDNRKTFTELRLLYVGTLYNRNIEQSIHGLSIFYRQYKDKIKIRYTIVGSGPGAEQEQLQKIVDQEKLNDVVTIVGQVPHDQIKPYFDTHNIGVSYIPMTDYYDVQPPLKTYEYLLSGMPVIATATQENMAVIRYSNGISVTDTPEGFAKGLAKFYENRNRYDSDKIRNHALSHTWCNIISEFNSYLNSIINENPYKKQHLVCDLEGCDDLNKK